MEQETVTKQDIHVSPTYRWLENGHILLWLIKDTCWVLVWRPGGIFMIFPTIGMAIYLMLKSRKIRAELYHNIAICLWICANSTWMVGEFFEIDHITKPIATGFFLSGLAVLFVYYVFFFAKDRRREKKYNLS